MDEYLGIIKLFAGNFAPKGWMYCNGQILPVAQNQALFSLLGTTYGGNGVTTFALPDLRGRAAIGQGQGTGLQNYGLGQTGGTETVTLLAQQMPLHNHILTASSTDGNTNVPTNALLAKGTATTSGGDSGDLNSYLTNGGATTTLANNSISTAGGNQPHENRPPYLALGYIICISGLYPSRS